MLLSRWRTEQRAAGRCDAGEVADGVNQRRAADAANRASAAGGGDYCVDRPVRLDHLSYPLVSSEQESLCFGG